MFTNRVPERIKPAGLERYSVSDMDGKVTTLTLRKVEEKRKLLETARAIRMKLNGLRASELSERQEFEKKCKPLIEPSKSLTSRKEEDGDINIKMMIVIKTEEEDAFDDAGDTSVEVGQ